ncbi:hypothetical protein BJF90_30725 [Pseudonocardia sp. CNS-004]|nr:hypothetical protein BJF90_30725 [Pseudonocardia sp. CNS-004]
MVDVAVVWDARRMRLAEWRSTFAPRGAEDVTIELIAPHGVGEGGHRVRVTGEEVRLEVAAGLRRAIGEEGPAADPPPVVPAPRGGEGPRGPPE